MTFEFLIACQETSGTDIRELLCALLAAVLEDNLNVFDDESVERMIIPRLQRIGEETRSNNALVSRRALLGFALELPDETVNVKKVLEDFIEILSNTPPINHVVKFEDPLLRADLVRRAEEIFSHEMKLRRVLTLIYLHAFRNVNPYDLLREEKVQPANKELPTPEQMKAATENQFFHLLFSQYVNLNQRPDFKLPALLDIIYSVESYERFRDELRRRSIEDEDDMELLAGLKERISVIENMRNCAAHNRRPSRKIMENYENALPILDTLLNTYIARWEWEEPEEETLWDSAASKAVESALEDALWDNMVEQSLFMTKTMSESQKQ